MIHVSIYKYRIMINYNLKNIALICLNDYASKSLITSKSPSNH